MGAVGGEVSLKLFEQLGQVAQSVLFHLPQSWSRSSSPSTAFMAATRWPAMRPVALFERTAQVAVVECLVYAGVIREMQVDGRCCHVLRLPVVLPAARGRFLLLGCLRGLGAIGHFHLVDKQLGNVDGTAVLALAREQAVNVGHAAHVAEGYHVGVGGGHVLRLAPRPWHC